MYSRTDKKRWAIIIYTGFSFFFFFFKASLRKKLSVLTKPSYSLLLFYLKYSKPSQCLREQIWSLESDSFDWLLALKSLSMCPWGSPLPSLGLSFKLKVDNKHTHLPHVQCTEQGRAHSLAPWPSGQSAFTAPCAIFAISENHLNQLSLKYLLSFL